MTASERTPPRGRKAVGMLKNLGDRLKSEERAPYEKVDHDDTIDFDEPTEDLILANNTGSDEGKTS